jgi:hypothetical protein
MAAFVFYAIVILVCAAFVLGVKFGHRRDRRKADAEYPDLPPLPASWHTDDIVSLFEFEYRMQKHRGQL